MIILKKEDDEDDDDDSQHDAGFRHDRIYMFSTDEWQ
jgi:hypothetical protein